MTPVNHRLKHELVALFGRQRVERAEALDVADLLLEPLNLSSLEPLNACSLDPIELPLFITAADMEAVEAAADALLKESGRPHRQRELVDRLDNSTALLLCMWQMDNGLSGHLTGDAA